MVIVRREEPGDQRAVHEVHAASFPTKGEARLVDALRSAARLFLSLVAVEEDQVVGHVAFSPVSVAGVLGGVGLAPVAVLPEHRRRGIAARLIREGLAACEQSGYGFVVVLGAPKYYQRFGFAAAIRYGLTDEWNGGEAFQALELRPGSIPRNGGLVQYAPEFATLESESTA